MLTSLSGKLPVDMITHHRFAYLLLIIAFVALLSGCQSAFGPQALARTHPAYNEAIITSINEQMLQNLVRMRYRDVPFFLEIGSVTASLSLGANAGRRTAQEYPQPPATGGHPGTDTIRLEYQPGVRVVF